MANSQDKRSRIQGIGKIKALKSKIRNLRSQRNKASKSTQNSQWLQHFGDSRSSPLRQKQDRLLHRRSFEALTMGNTLPSHQAPSFAPNAALKPTPSQSAPKSLSLDALLQGLPGEPAKVKKTLPNLQDQLLHARASRSKG